MQNRVTRCSLFVGKEKGRGGREGREGGREGRGGRGGREGREGIKEVIKRERGQHVRTEHTYMYIHAHVTVITYSGTSLLCTPLGQEKMCPDWRGDHTLYFRFVHKGILLGPQKQRISEVSFKRGSTVYIYIIIHTCSLHTHTYMYVHARTRLPGTLVFPRGRPWVST